MLIIEQHAIFGEILMKSDHQELVKDMYVCDGKVAEM